MTTPDRQVKAGTDLRRVLGTVAAACAAAGGLIHLAQAGKHRDLEVSPWDSS
jgi:hypothetical protein